MSLVEFTGTPHELGIAILLFNARCGVAPSAPKHSPVAAAAHASGEEFDLDSVVALPDEDAATFKAVIALLRTSGVDFNVTVHAPVRTSEEVRARVALFIARRSRRRVLHSGGSCAWRLPCKWCKSDVD